VCAYHCAQLLYTTEHRTVLIIFPLILQTITIAQTMSTGGGGGVRANMMSSAKPEIHNVLHCWLTGTKPQPYLRHASVQTQCNTSHSTTGEFNNKYNTLHTPGSAHSPESLRLTETNCRIGLSDARWLTWRPASSLFHLTINWQQSTSDNERSHTKPETRTINHHHHHIHFTALLSGSPGWAGARRELLDFMVKGKFNRGKHTDHPAGRHSIWTNQYPPPPSPHIFYRPDALPATQPTASKHWRQLVHSDRKKTLESSSTVLPAPSPYHKRRTTNVV